MQKKFKTVDESQVIISELMLPSRANFSGKIHGGYILSLLDQAAFACASKHSGIYCVTASVDTVDFLNPISVGELVTMRASINYVGKTSMVVGIRVDSENIQTGESKHCNSSYFTMVAISPDKKVVAIPGLILKTEQDLQRFFKSINRINHKKERKEYSSKIEYSVKELIHELDGHNIKIEL